MAKIGAGLSLRAAAPAVAALLLVALLTLVSVAGRGAAGPRPSAAATPLPDATLKQACIDGAAVGPANDELASDCALLLEVKDSLRGTATLNWSADLAIGSWTGVTSYGSPQRVIMLRIRSGGLDGSIPAALGGLIGLGQLVLRDNQLTGSIPAALGSLTGLCALDLRGNELAGEIPPELVHPDEPRGAVPVRQRRAHGLHPHGLGVVSGGSSALGRLNLPDCGITYTLTTSAGDTGASNRRPALTPTTAARASPSRLPPTRGTAWLRGAATAAAAA